MFPSKEDTPLSEGFSKNENARVRGGTARLGVAE